MTAQISTTRRSQLAEIMKDGESVVLFANPAANLEKFSQDCNFLYLTGLNYPDLIYIAEKKNGSFSDILFIERSNPEREVWDGKKLQSIEARDLSGIERISYLDDFYTTLTGVCSTTKHLYSNLGNVAINKPLSYAMFMLEPVRQRYPHIVIDQINNLITPLRKVKSEWEIMQLQKAIDITGKGIMDIWESATVGMMEYELEAMLFYRMQKSGVQRWGFAPIVAAGINAATLHYGQNECRIEQGELVLLDVGASYNGYSADITRCFPISGTFSDRQKQIYAIVLKVQKSIIEMIKPGVLLSELNRATRQMLIEELMGIDLISAPEEIGKYYMHYVGHFLGMDTHDVGGREAVLEIGNVITIEPGVYISEERLGVRIEDDVLITRDGYCVLSQNIPKEIDDIEAIRKVALNQ
ncbi:MAG: Xaa-Pro aminopeptidase [Candidatus Cloacimonetes bacterium HGW-Cloacimonetes-1]|nr:MAG: Xaa-Pro aminopeptidase [Candidatus Cloacimonetes bacterium HGW-Cloacimonetes-1]